MGFLFFSYFASPGRFWNLGSRPPERFWIFQMGDAPNLRTLKTIKITDVWKKISPDTKIEILCPENLCFDYKFVMFDKKNVPVAHFASPGYFKNWWSASPGYFKNWGASHIWKSASPHHPSKKNPVSCFKVF